MGIQIVFNSKGDTCILEPLVGSLVEWGLVAYGKVNQAIEKCFRRGEAPNLIRNGLVFPKLCLVYRKIEASQALFRTANCCKKGILM